MSKAFRTEILNWNHMTARCNTQHGATHSMVQHTAQNNGYCGGEATIPTGESPWYGHEQPFTGSY